MRLGDVAYEYKERIGEEATDRPVYGVDKSVGLTAEPRYQSSNLSRYKRIEHGMFAYNPMRLNIGSIGFCHDELAPGIVSPDYVVFGCRNGALLPKFMDYHTRSAPWSDWLSLAGEGSVRERIYFRKLETYELALPDVLYQEAAVEILSSLDDKIGLNRRINETLEDLAQAIFKDWFVTFGPTRRKMAGATDPVVILGGLIPDPAQAAPLAALFSEGLGEDGLPEGWEEQIIEDVLELAYGKSLPATKRVDGNVPVYGSGGVTGTHNTPLVQGPGIVIGRKGTVGSRYWEQSDFYPIDTVFFVRPKQNVPLEYLWELLSGLALEEMNTDAAVPGLNRNNVYRLEVPRPPASLIEAFWAMAEPIRAHIEHNKKENRTLAETRDYLLPKLMSGAVRVRNVEAMGE